MTVGEVSRHDVWEHAWSFFELHARQRMSLFNFFLVLSALLFAGLSFTFRAESEYAMVGMALASFLAAVSYVFWKLDKRVSLFLKLAEDALAEIEQAFPIEAARLVARERERTSVLRAQHHRFSWSRHFTYGEAFRVIFRVVGLLSVVAAILLFLRHMDWLAW